MVQHPSQSEKLDALMVAIQELAREVRETRRPVIRYEEEEKAATRREAAEALRIGLSTLKVWISTGYIFTCEGNSRLIPRSEIRRLLAPKKDTPRPSRHARRKARTAGGKSKAEKVREMLRQKRS